MTISFTPALGEIVHIAVKHDATSARLRFTAVLFVHEFRYYETSGAKVQIWSDVPTTSDGWEARNFESSEGQSRRSSMSDEMDFDQVVLSLVVDAPLKATTRSYSFTYRILYPSGEVKWMGTARTNGEFIFQRHCKPRMYVCLAQSLDMINSTQTVDLTLLEGSQMSTLLHLLSICK